MIEIRSRVTWADPLSKSLTRSFQISSRGSGIFVLRGPNAIGKTTLLMAIAYALGDDSLKDDLEKRGCTIDLHIGINGTSIEIYRDASKYILRMNGREISDSKEVKDIVREFFDVAYVPVERIVGIRAISRILREFCDAARKIYERSNAMLSEAQTILKEITFYRRLSARIEMMKKELQKLERKLESSKKQLEEKSTELNELKRIKPLLETIRRTEMLPELEKRLKTITEELERKRREKEELMRTYEERAREFAAKTVEMKTKLEILTKEVERLEEELKSVERELEKLAHSYEESSIPDLRKLAAAIRRENINDIERMYRKSLSVLGTLQFAKLQDEKRMIERLLEVCRSAPDLSLQIRGLNMSVDALISKLRKGLAEVDDLLRREREKEKIWLNLKNACKDALDLLKRREKIKMKLKSLKDELKKLEVEYKSFEIRAVRMELSPTDERRLRRLEREIEILEREKHELREEIEKLEEVAKKREEIMKTVEDVARKIGVEVSKLTAEDLSEKISSLEEELGRLEEEYEGIKERIDEIKGRIVSYEEMLKEREKYVSHMLDEEENLKELIKILQRISDIMPHVMRISADNIDNIRSYMETLKWQKEKDEIYRLLYETLTEMGNIIAELMGGIWDYEHGWLRVRNIDFEKEIITLVSPDGRVIERKLSEFSRGQLGLASILPMIHKPTEARFGKVILVDEIGDLDPDRRKEIINQLKERREKYGDLCFAILVLPGMKVEMVDAEQNPDAMR